MNIQMDNMQTMKIHRVISMILSLVMIFSIGLLSLFPISVSVPSGNASDAVFLPIKPVPAYASINVGNETTIEGWQPSDIVSTNVNVPSDPQESSQMLQNVVIRVIKVIMPFLMIGCVAIIVYNAVGNIFRKPEKRVKMGPLIKNMLIQFFFIVFAWLIVEGIVFIVSGGETILFSAILGN